MRLLRRFAYWLRIRSHHSDLMDELAFHREMLERDLVRGGLSHDAASVQARRAMGNETFMREESRAVWLRPSIEALWQDATYTLRGLRRSPVFTTGVTLTLALGIGANAAMFSLVDRLLFRAPARMIDPASVNRVYLFRTVRGKESQTGGQYARYADLARWSTAFTQTAGFTLRRLAIGVGDGTQVKSVAVVSANFFGFFDAPPILGRYFTPSEDAPPNPAPVAVLSRALWESQFGSRADVLGSAVHIDAVAYTIIGVAPDGFVGLWPYRPPAAFVPVTTFAANRGRPEWATTYSSFIGLEIIVRRKPDVTVAAASADLTNALTRSFQAQMGVEPETPSLDRLRPRALAASVLTERGPEPSSTARAATWLSGVALIVLLIACANVANLLLARTIVRRREIAVRITLGVSRGRLFGQLLTEGLLLALLGGGAGLVIAFLGGDVLREAFLPRTQGTSLITDSRTLIFAAAVVLGVGVLTGLAPMAQARRGSLVGDLKSGVREGTHQRARLRSVLLLLQGALSVLLLVGAGLFVQSVRNVRQIRLGYDADSVLLAELNMRDVALDSAATVALRLRLLNAAKEIPGVSFASLQESIPLGGATSWPIFVSGIDSVRKLGVFEANTVSEDYFATMGTRILRGRGIRRSDDENGRQVMVVGESMGAALWPGRDPIDQCVRIWADTMPCRYVVGIAEDIRSHSIETASGYFFYYLPAAQMRPQDGGLFIRVRDASRMAEPVRRRLQRAMPGSAFVTITRLGDIVDGRMRSWTVGATLFTVFGGLALLLATVGLYSAIAYNVTQRKHELGVRLALGASRAGIVRFVMTQGVRFALGGIVIGGLAALAAGKWVAPLLFQQSPRDPAVFALVTTVLLSVAVAASAIPAWRAAGVDPTTALRSD